MARAVYLIVLQASWRAALSKQAKGKYLTEWTATLKSEPGDIGLFYFGMPSKAVAAIGVVNSEPKRRPGPFNWTDAAQTFCDYSPAWVLDTPVPLEAVADAPIGRRWFQGRPYRSTR